MTDLIQVTNVYKIYHEGEDNEVRALDNVSANIAHGEFVAILGSSGSGKSTFMNIIGCLDVPTYGDYILHGKEVSTMTDRELSKIRNLDIGFIFQGFNLIHALDAIENVELPLIYRGMRKAERRKLAFAALQRVGLAERIYHRPNEMSGGQQQRVAIARAIAAQPPIIMADEPTGNLDSKSGKDVMEILTNLNNEGHTIILITHDADIAAMAKRTIQIHDGHVIRDTAKEGTICP